MEVLIGFWLKQFTNMVVNILYTKFYDLPSPVVCCVMQNVIEINFTDTQDKKYRLI